LLEAEHLAQLAQDELAPVIRALRPAALDGKGLVAVAQEYTTQWSARMGIAVTLQVSGERASPLSSEETLLRVMQEALANVARHSGATQVRVALVWHADEIRMEIVDNGHGFLVQRESPGVGLKSMRERVEAAQGTLAMDSSPNGTTIVAGVPLRMTQLAMQAEP
jgi:signal transduction histidine kinase